MTRTLIPSIALLTLIACGTGNGKRTIDITIEGAGGRTVHFNRFQSNRPVPVDSVKLDADGKGTIKLPALPLDYYQLALDNDKVILALDSNESVKVDASLGMLSMPKSVTGSANSEALHGFYKEAKAFDDERERLRVAVSTNGDTALIRQFNNLNAAFYETCKAFAAEHASSPAALAALGRLDMQRELPLFKQVRDSLRKTMPRSGFFTMMREQVDRLEQQEIVMKMQEEEMKRLSNMLPAGGPAPEIRQNTPDGGSYALSQLRGKVVLIDFWASWCRPCRIENPNVKKVYAKYASKGFEILGVSLDRDHAAWVKAIKDDGLPWKHVSDLGFWNNAAAQEYGVQSIPYTVLVDRDGNIIEKGLRAHELDARLEQLFGS
ncbi:MAG: TlpA family protein disulfide reductase [Flavobacteriales bacterium]|nr:TlpA family protein disulfide reductase [Flavobacteriales bacterium]